MTTTPKESPAKRHATPPTSQEDRPIFFFKPDGDYGEFCQWYPVALTVSKSDMSALVGHAIDSDDPEGRGAISFNCAEQFMMYCKAGLFHDADTQRQILATSKPRKQKSLGRSAKGFQASSWDKIKSAVAVAGNLAKFEQNPDLKAILLGTGNRLLAEASSYDRVWGIGFTADEAIAQRANWGENTLGEALMEVRERLR